MAVGDVIEIEKLTKVYRSGVRRRSVYALRGLDLTVEENEVFGFLGPNGAGKTTTLKILVGLLFPTSGKARILGKPLNHIATKALIGFLPENPYFYEYLTGAELLDFYCRLFGMPKSQRKTRTEELLRRVGLIEAADLQVRKYSHGMRQRLGIAQALVNDPKLLFLDEPMTGLDPVGRRQIRDMIGELRAEGKTIFFSSHILSDAELVCDRVGILIDGKLRNIGRLDEILQPQKALYDAVAVNVDGQVAKRLSKFCRQMVRRANRLHLLIVDDDGLKEAQRLVVGAGGYFESLARTRMTLEDRFIEFIGASANGRRGRK